MAAASARRLALVLTFAWIAMALPSQPTGADPGSPPSPSDLKGVFDGLTNSITLSWNPPSGWSGLTYNVYRDGTLVGTTTSTSFTDGLNAMPAPGYVYYVSVTWHGYNSPPAVTGTPTLNCEVVSILTSWSWPYVYVHLHEECLGIPYDKDTTWHA